MADVYVLDYVRTPRGKASPGGGLHHRTPLDLTASLLGALTERNGLRTSQVDDIMLGIASQVGEQGANLARTAALMAEWDSSVPGLTLNRFCASGIDAVALAASRIRAGDASMIVAGGVESVSRVPIFSDRGPLWTDPSVVTGIGSIHMGIAADLDATISDRAREQLDAYALETHSKAARAWAQGVFDAEVIAQPGEAPSAPFAVDELVRADLTPERLAELPAAFAGIGAEGQDALVAQKHPWIGPLQHLHTVGTSPQMADGGALLLLGDEESAALLGGDPLARVVASVSSAADPVIMLTAGQEAVQLLLERTALQTSQIDVFEFAEAFASLCLRFRDATGAGPDRMNPNGGTMAMGHAFGATGAIMVGGCASELRRREGRYGVAAVSGAAGLGTALLLERPATWG